LKAPKSLQLQRKISLLTILFRGGLIGLYCRKTETRPISKKAGPRPLTGEMLHPALEMDPAGEVMQHESTG